MILVDTSAWVEYDRATGSVVDRRLRDLIRDEAALATTEAVGMEVLAGAKTDEREDDLRRLLARFTLLRVDAVPDVEAAARIYRRCRREGVTPRGLLDCLIVAVAVRHRAELLAADADIVHVARVLGVGVDVDVDMSARRRRR